MVKTHCTPAQCEQLAHTQSGGRRNDADHRPVGFVELFQKSHEIRSCDVKDYLSRAGHGERPPYGLSAGIVTTSQKYASHFKRHSTSGLVMVNLPGGTRLSRPVWRAKEIWLRPARAGHLREGVLHRRQDRVCGPIRKRACIFFQLQPGGERRGTARCQLLRGNPQFFRKEAAPFSL
jgi:hypothetical protein